MGTTVREWVKHSYTRSTQSGVPKNASVPHNSFLGIHSFVSFFFVGLVYYLFSYLVLFHVACRSLLLIVIVIIVAVIRWQTERQTEETQINYLNLIQSSLYWGLKMNYIAKKNSKGLFRCGFLLLCTNPQTSRLKTTVRDRDLKKDIKRGGKGEEMEEKMKTGRENSIEKGNVKSCSSSAIPTVQSQIKRRHRIDRQTQQMSC